MKMISNFFNKINLLKQAKIDDNNDCEIVYSWIWEFSKKVVFAIFLIYIVNYLVCWGASFLCGIKGWDIPYIDTFITSTNETTQIVLGGYFIKAMAENVFSQKNRIVNTTQNNCNCNENIETNNDYTDM